jgi:hypothetical protein
MRRQATFGIVLWLLACGLARGEGEAPTLQERLGHPRDARLLIIHADDVGMAHSVNRASLEALEQGWITSASVLVPCPWLPDVARFARAHPDADLGIHLALNSEWTGYRWGPVSPKDAVASLLDPDGYFPLVETTVAQKARLPEVERELRAQIEWARSLGIRITHFDTHMGALLGSPGLTEIYRRLGREYALPVMLERQPGQPVPPGEVLLDRVIGIDSAAPQAEWQAAYERLLAPLGPGVYELIVHLAYDDEEMRGATWDHPDYGAAWRQFDLDMVRSAGFRDFLRAQRFVLVNWRDLARALQPATASN